MKTLSHIPSIEARIDVQQAKLEELADQQIALLSTVVQLQRAVDALLAALKSQAAKRPVYTDYESAQIAALEEFREVRNGVRG
jgi:hypothetical protein